MPVFFAASVFAVIIFFAVILMAVWVLVALLRGFIRLLVGSSRPVIKNVAQVRAARVMQCARSECLAQNPAHSRFCRRCGSRLNAAQARRVA